MFSENLFQFPVSEWPQDLSSEFTAIIKPRWVGVCTTWLILTDFFDSEIETGNGRVLSTKQSIDEKFPAFLTLRPLLKYCEVLNSKPVESHTIYLRSHMGTFSLLKSAKDPVFCSTRTEFLTFLSASISTTTENSEMRTCAQSLLE